MYQVNIEKTISDHFKILGKTFSNINDTFPAAELVYLIWQFTTNDEKTENKNLKKNK